MKYNQPYGITDPLAPYVNGNPALGVQGSIPPAAAIEYPQREILAVIESAGLVPSNSDLTQVLQALQWHLGNITQDTKIHFGEAGGTANVITTTLAPVPASLAPGRIILLKIASNNEGGGVTLNPNGEGAIPVVKPSGSALDANDLVAGQVALMVTSVSGSNATRFELIGSIAAANMAETSFLHYGVDNGAKNALVTTLAPTITSYAAGLLALVKVSVTNDAAATINCNSLGVKAIKTPAGADLAANTLIGGGVAILVYDGTNFQFVGMMPDNAITANLAQNGYMQWANGFKIQWGRYTDNVFYQHTVNVVFPIAFTTGVYICIATTPYLGWNWGTGTVNIEARNLSLTNTDFFVRNHVEMAGCLDHGFHWIAFGK